MSLPGKALRLASESRMYECPHFEERPQVNLLLRAIVMFLTQKLKFLLHDHLSVSLIPISFVGPSFLSTTRWLRPTVLQRWRELDSLKWDLLISLTHGKVAFPTPCLLLEGKEAREMKGANEY